MRMSLALTIGAAALMATSVVAQRPADLSTTTQPYKIDSGALDNTTNAERIVFSRTISAPNAPWMQLRFGDATLPDGSYLKITDHEEGLSQRLAIESLVQWNLTSAQMRGETITLQLVAGPNTLANQIVVTHLVTGGVGIDSICGSVDDRQLSNDARQGRLAIGCTGWMVSSDIMLTAGHCTNSVGSNSTIGFNVPLSSSGGSTNPSAPNDQYPFTVLARLNAGVGSDWAVCRVSPNSNTGLLPTQANGGQFYQLGFVPASTGGNTIRITGYGSTSSPVSPTWNLVQKTHTGPLAVINPTSLRYATDTTGGNSGSPVFHENTGAAIGIHTHAGCNSSGGSNQGTRIDRSDLLAALANVGIGIGGTPGTFNTFGAGCPTSVTAPPQCATSNPTGGTLVGTTATNEYAYQATASSNLSVVGFDIYSRSTTGSNETVAAAIYTDAGGGPSANPVAQTTVNIGGTAGFYTATFASPVAIPAGTFYISVDHSSGSTVLSELTSGSAGSAFWRRPPLGGGSWSASGLVSAPSFIVNCNGAGGFTVPAIAGSGAPVVNQSFTTSMAGATPNAFAVLMMGFSDTTSGSTPLPFNLGGFGASACDILVDPFLNYGATTSASGGATRNFNVPNDASLVGTEAFQQWYVLDNGANSLGVSFSNGLRIVVGG